MSKPKRIENDWEEKLKKHRSEMEIMLDEGATVGRVFQVFNINSRFQKDFHARYKEVYGYTLLDYKRRIREKELEKQKAIARSKKKRQDQRTDIKECLADVILSVVSEGNNINDTLFEYKVYNQRQDINEVVMLLFDHSLLELKQDPSLVDADYVLEMCRLYRDGVKITKGLKSKTLKEIKKQQRNLTDEERRNKRLESEVNSKNNGLIGLVKLNPELEDQLRDAYKSFAENLIGQEDARKHIREKNALLNPVVDNKADIPSVKFDDINDNYFDLISLKDSNTLVANSIIKQLAETGRERLSDLWSMLEVGGIGGGRVWLDPKNPGSSFLLEEGVNKETVLQDKADIVMVPRWIRDLVPSVKQVGAHIVGFDDVSYPMYRSDLQAGLEKCKKEVLEDIQNRMK